MANPNKSQGTREETRVKEEANRRLGLTARRYAEGGSNDPGDVEIVSSMGTIAVEVKAAQTISPVSRLAKQTLKSPPGSTPALVWNRRIKIKPEHKRRTSVGILVFMWWGDFVGLRESSGIEDDVHVVSGVRQFPYHSRMAEVPERAIRWQREDKDIAIVYLDRWLDMLEASV